MGRREFRIYVMSTGAGLVPLGNTQLALTGEPGGTPANALSATEGEMAEMRESVAAKLEGVRQVKRLP